MRITRASKAVNNLYYAIERKCHGAEIASLSGTTLINSHDRLAKVLLLSPL